MLLIQLISSVFKGGEHAESQPVLFAESRLAHYSQMSQTRVLDRQALVELLELSNHAALECQHQAMINEAVTHQNLERDERWTESLAVGSSDFATEFRALIKAKGKCSQAIDQEGCFVVRERLTAYGPDFDPQN